MNWNEDNSGKKLPVTDGKTFINPLYLLVAILVLGYAWRAAFMYRDVGWITNFWLFEDFGYSLKIAKNIAMGLGETFDGVIPTNGYQPLYVWLMVPAFWIFDTNLVAPIYVAVTLLALSNVATGYAIYAILKRLTGHHYPALLGAAFWMFNIAIAKDGTNGLEAGLSTMLVAFSANYFLATERHTANNARDLKLGMLLGISFLGRVDAVFLAAAVGIAILFLTDSPTRVRIRFAAITVAGFLLIAAPYAMWNIVHFGSPLPTSGQVTSGKNSLFAFGQLDIHQLMHNVAYGLHIIWRILTGNPTINGWVAEPQPGESGAMGVLLSIVFCLGVLIVNRAAYTSRTLRGIAFLVIMGAMYVYGYTIHTFVPFERYFLPVVMVLTVLYAMTLHALFWRSQRKLDVALGWLIGLSLGTLASVGAVSFIKGDFPQPFGWREGTNELNRIARPGDIVAGLQAGNLGYFYTQGRAVNLDGVVNMDAYRARQAGELDRYIAQQRVKYLADEGGWVFNIAHDIKDPERRTSFLAGLTLVHKSPAYLFNIYQVGEVDYAAVRKLGAQPQWESRENANLLHSTALFASTPGSRLEFTSSRCFDLKFLKHDWSGIANVYRDGQLIREIDLYSKSADPTFKTSFKADSAAHDYTIEVSGKKNPDSHATEVWFDAVLERASCSGTGA